jgi:NAD(P)H-hydrate epimerase
MSVWNPPHPPELPVDAHKGIAGRVLLACGSAWMPGAAVLAARAAQRAGAGLVTVVCQDNVLRHVVPVAAPEAILEHANLVAFSSGNWHAGVVGPGIGQSREARALVENMVDEFEAPLVVDADALNLLAHDLASLAERRFAKILTPHPGEAARLLGRIVPADETGRVSAAREIARISKSICVLKGHRTVVTDGERVYVNDTGNPGMATAGAGDVLAGITVAYLALCRSMHQRTWTPFDAAARAVHVHGIAGDIAADRRGTRGVIASDLIETLPEAQRA